MALGRQFVGLRRNAMYQDEMEMNAQVGQLSQPNRAAACVSFGENISVKSMHLTSVYPTASTSKNNHRLIYVTMFVLNAKLCSI